MPATPAMSWDQLIAEIAALAAPATLPPVYCSAMADTAIVRVSGADAEEFLHAQLSADCRALAPGDACLTAWCSPQGRVLFLLRVLRTGDGFLLLLPGDQSASLVRRLRMFILRAAVTVDDISATVSVLRIDGAAGSAPDTGNNVAQCRDGDTVWLIGPPEVLTACWQRLDVPALGPAAALLHDIRHGIPRLGTAVLDQFLPQELDLDLGAGISFDKGCYPGQEIIARVKFRGQVKRRLAHFSTAAGTALPTAGSRLQDSDGKATGSVLIATATDTTMEVLAVLNAGATAVHLEEGEDRLTQHPLPGRGDTT